jgi:hypothetical protein
MSAAEQVAAEWERTAPSLLGEYLECLAGDVAGWEEIYELMCEPMEEDLLVPVAAAVAAATAALSRPPKRAKRVTAYSYPSSRQVAPEPYVPRPTRTRGAAPVKQWVPEAQRKRICIDLTADSSESEGEVEYGGYFWSSHSYVPQWRQEVVEIN